MLHSNNMNKFKISQKHADGSCCNSYTWADIFPFPFIAWCRIVIYVLLQFLFTHFHLNHFFTSYIMQSPKAHCFVMCVNFYIVIINFFQGSHKLFVIAFISFVVNQNSLGVIFAIFRKVDILVMTSSATGKGDPSWRATIKIMLVKFVMITAPLLPSTPSLVGSYNE